MHLSLGTEYRSATAPSSVRASPTSALDSSIGIAFKNTRFNLLTAISNDAIRCSIALTALAQSTLGVPVIAIGFHAARLIWSVSAANDFDPYRLMKERGISYLTTQTLFRKYDVQQSVLKLHDVSVG